MQIMVKCASVDLHVHLCNSRTNALLHSITPMKLWAFIFTCATHGPMHFCGPSCCNIKVELMMKLGCRELMQ